MINLINCYTGLKFPRSNVIAVNGFTGSLRSIYRIRGGQIEELVFGYPSRPLEEYVFADWYF